MPKQEMDLRPVIHITIDAIGKPGQRVFYIQGWEEARCITLIIEKIQVQTLAIGIEEFLAEISDQYPNLDVPISDYQEGDMRIQPPLDPLFRVGEFSLGYNAETDLVVLVATQTILEGQDPSETAIVRFWCTRSQVFKLARWGLEVTTRGRPLCPLCGQPISPGESHFCPKKNGRQH